MINGTYTYYVVEQRRKAEGKWLKLDSKIAIIPEKDRGEFSSCGSDYWGRSMNPRIGSGNERRPQNRASDRQFYECYNATGQHGWWDLKYAAAALDRVVKDDEGGMYNSYDGYGKFHQHIRHEFRVTKVTLVYKREFSAITPDDVLQAIRPKRRKT